MKLIQRDTKLNRHSIPILDPPRKPRTLTDTTAVERDAKLKATERHYDEMIKRQAMRRHTYTKPLRRF